MRVAIPWLKKFVHIEESLAELADMLSMLGLEAEVPEKSTFSGVVVGHVLQTEKHPNADRLILCIVSDGEKEYQVVCGAPNVASGQKVPFAKVGANLDGFKIKKTKIRGETSFGMICSERELKLSDNHDGIMVLSEEVQIGRNFQDYLAESQNYLEIDLTPNRPDCLSHVGVARDIAVKTGRKFHPPEYKRKKMSKNEVDDILSIEIEDKSGCPRYVAGVVKNVKVGPSPAWMVEYLESAGQRSINNIVDISNFVLLEMGHPTHIFDYDKIPSKIITIRKAKNREIVTTLDGVKRVLTDQLLITNGQNPVAIAGVMGGLETAVRDTTTSVLIESAYFDPVTIRKGAKSLGIQTEASKRFERGADPEGAMNAFWRVLELLEEMTGGEWVPGVIDAYPEKIEQKSITLTQQKIDILSGCELSDVFIKKTLSGLGVNVKETGEGEWQCIPPSFRPDLEREVDLIEECCRIYGYNNIHSSFHYGGLYDIGDVDPEDKIAVICEAMAGLGFNQCFQNSLTDEKTASLLNDEPIAMMNPLSSKMSHLRTSLFPGLIQIMDYNINNGNPNLRIFEIGKEYSGKNNYKEEFHITGIVHGEWIEKNIHHDKQNHSIFSLKGLVTAFLDRIRVTNLIFDAAEISQYDYGFNILISKKCIGHIGLLRKSLVNELDSAADSIFGFDLQLQSILDAMNEKKKYDSIVHFPKVDRDMNFVLNESILADTICQTINNSGSHLLIDVKPIDIFRHDSIGKNKKSVTFHLVFQSPVKTLEEAEINSIMNDITAVLSKEFDAKLRDY